VAGADRLRVGPAKATTRLERAEQAGTVGAGAIVAPAAPKVALLPRRARRAVARKLRTACTQDTSRDATGRVDRVVKRNVDGPQSVVNPSKQTPQHCLPSVVGSVQLLELAHHRQPAMAQVEQLV